MGTQELAVIGVIVLVLLFLPGRLPAMARSVTDGIREFRRIGKDDDDGARG